MLCKNTAFNIYFFMMLGSSFILFPTDSSLIKTINAEDTLICIIDQEKPSIIMGSMDVCPYCNSIYPTFERLAQKYPHIQFVKADGKKCNMHKTVERESKGTYKIIGYPAFVLVAHKEIKNLLLGGNPKALEAAVKEFNDLLQASNMHT